MGKVISGIGRGIGKLLGVNTDPPPLPPVPPPPPIVPRQAVQPKDSVSAKTKEKVKARRGRSGTIKTSPRGVSATTENIRYKSLLSGDSDD